MIYIQDDQHYLHIFHTMWDMFRLSEARTWHTQYQTKSKIPLEPGQTLYLELGTTRKRSYAKFGFKPAALTEVGLAQLYALLTVLLPDGYVTLFNDGKISYLEIAADFSDVNIDDVLIFDERLQNSTILPGGFAPVETIYVGHRKHSRKRFCAYDKAKQLGCLGTIVEGTLTRIEVRSRRVGLPMRELPLLNNPFPTLSVVAKDDSRELLSSDEFSGFHKDCGIFGAHEALQRCNLAQRKHFSRILRRASCDWWQPEILWERWPEALQVLTPRYDLTF